MRRNVSGVDENLDEITSKEENIEALIDQFTIVDLKISPIRSVRQAYGGTQIRDNKLTSGSSQ